MQPFVTQRVKAPASHDAVVLPLSPPPTPATAVKLTRLLQKSEEAWPPLPPSMLVTPLYTVGNILCAECRCAERTLSTVQR